MSACACRKLVAAGWAVRCGACGADTLTPSAPAEASVEGPVAA